MCTFGLGLFFKNEGPLSYNGYRDTQKPGIKSQSSGTKWLNLLNQQCLVLYFPCFCLFIL